MFPIHPHIEHSIGELRVVGCFFCNLSSGEGGAIYDTSNGNTAIEMSGFYGCTASSRGGCISSQNGVISLSTLCFEKCAVVASGNGYYGHCAYTAYSRGTLAQNTAFKCGYEHLKYGDTPFAFFFSAQKTRDLNTSFCFGYGTPGATYWHNSEDSEEIHTVYACCSGEMANELNAGRGSFIRHNTVNCSAFRMDRLFNFDRGTVALAECCYFGNAYSDLLYGNSPSATGCLASPAVSGFGPCRIEDLHARVIVHTPGCRSFCSVELTQKAPPLKTCLLICVLLVRPN